MFIKQQSIRTKRLVLRPLQPSDYAAWVLANDDASAAQNEFDYGKQPAHQMTRAAFRRKLKNQNDLWYRDRAYLLAIFHKKKYVGSVSLILHTRVVLQTAALGCSIRNNHWRQGFATEAVEGAVMFAFKKLKLHRIVAEIRTTNEPSARAVRKIGFRKEGVAKRYLFEHGKWNDMLIFALTAEERGIRGQKPKIRLKISEA